MASFSDGGLSDSGLVTARAVLMGGVGGFVTAGGLLAIGLTDFGGSSLAMV